MSTGSVANFPAGRGFESVSNADDHNLAEKIKSRRTNELVVGVCGAVGCNLQDVVAELASQFGSYGYEIIHIKVSGLIKKFAAVNREVQDPSVELSEIDNFDFFSRYKALQDLGNAIRDKYSDDALAVQSIKLISAERKIKMNASGDQVPPRTVFIVDQLKHPAEVNLFKLTYRNAFFLVGIVSPRSARLDYLQAEGLDPVTAQNLIERDRKDNVKHGQHLEKTIHRSDFFLRHSLKDSGNIAKPCKRFVGLVHGENGITPTRDESGMYAAYSASLKSACLSRQVGAAIADQSGNIVSVGWNDVPAGGGGLYSEDSESDQRCIVHGKKCYNDDNKRRLAKEIVGILTKVKRREANGIEAQINLLDITAESSNDADEIDDGSSEDAGLAISSKDAAKLVDRILNDTSLGSIIEYSRAIHAEMEAILNVARGAQGTTHGAVMYTTTYPCHNCARHIIAAGISRVVYIEPYEKSLAMKLHADAISVEGASRDKVFFDNFEGVSPTRYTNLFAFGDRRKDEEGRAVKVVGKNAALISSEYLDSYLSIELKVAARGLEDSGEQG
ncbi:anti-phage dCTP deaminase [Pseudomonas sp. JUb52]|uniref:anti-phage dCTP deaminase n=1 Tax=Pseudomonas sp. JUb52 TaxID=2485127 RepID=UPI00104910A4|nr:anti-phage dCTP deaminase [Pseudomonas sp. JUb52]TCQ84589.1 cytidine/deoxycytidylate deaminase-like protein [Pseudomonas sp. JUb52]